MRHLMEKPEDAFHQRPDGKYEVADVLNATVALGSADGSKIITLSLDLSSYDGRLEEIFEDLLEKIRESSVSAEPLRLQVAVPTEIARRTALQLLKTAKELGSAPREGETHTDSPCE